MDLESIYSLIQDDLKSVDQVIRGEFRAEIPFIDTVCEYIIDSGGKRLRPLTVILGAKAVGYTGDLHIKLAASMEFFHTATLLHDDVIDESTVRRGRTTANKVFGAKASVLIGDFLFTRAFQLLAEARHLDVVTLLANTSNLITKGEVLQLINCNDPNTTLEQYMQVIQHKTAVLFAAAAKMGALLNNNAEILDNMHAYGLHLGNAFQLIDDALDYTSSIDVIGKAIGDDLAEGKPTLPLIYTLANGTEEQQALIRHAITRASIENLDAILGAITSCGAINYTYDIARQEIDKALSAIHPLKESPYKQALISLAMLSLERTA